MASLQLSTTKSISEKQSFISNKIISNPKIAEQNENLRESVYAFGVPKKIEPFMTMAFIALSVIPHIKITTTGLIDVDKQERIPLFCD